MTPGSAKDFFISYNKADRAWAEWIAWRLEEAGYTTLLQAWDFSAGSNFVVDQANPAAAALLQFCAFLAPDAIAEEMISQGSDKLGDILGPVATDSFKLNAAIEILRRYSLVHRTTKTLTMHRLVQIVLQENMSLEMQRLWAGRAINVVNNYALNFSSSAAGNLFFEKCMPHAYTCAELIDRYGLVTPAASELLMTCRDYAHTFARYKEAENFYQKTLTLREQTSGSESSAIAPVLYRIAQLYYMQDRYQEAESTYRRALKIYTITQGEENNIAEVHAALGQLYHQQGLYQQAEEHYKQALIYYIEKLKVDEMPEAAILLQELATLYEEQGKYQQAEELFERAVTAIKLKPSITTNQIDMSAMLDVFVKHFQKKEEYEKVEEFYQETLSAYEKHFGSGHPDIATILHELARHKRGQGKYEEAEVFYKKALNIEEKANQSGAYTIYQPGHLYHTQSKYEQAASYYQRALAIQEKEPGIRHPDTIQTIRDYAALLRAMGRESEAVALEARTRNDEN